MREERQLGIRKLAPEDAVHLRVWLNDERVLTYYEGRDRPHDDAMIRANFFRKTMKVSAVFLYFSERSQSATYNTTPSIARTSWHTGTPR